MSKYLKAEGALVGVQHSWADRDEYMGGGLHLQSPLMHPPELDFSSPLVFRLRCGDEYQLASS